MTTMLCAAPVAALWSDPETTADDDRLTEILLGEPVEVVQRDGSRAYVVALWQPSSRDPRGYPGWVDAAALVPGEVSQLPTAVVTAPTAAVTVAGGETVVEASFGTRLPVLADAGDGVLEVELPGGLVGFVEQVGLRVPGAPVVDTAHELLDAGRQFLGLEYVWGGLSDRGLDCSGLVHLVHRTFGRTVPRDAFDQAAGLPAVDVSDVRPGDLLFFGRPDRKIHHVGFATGVADSGRPIMLHASERDRYLMEGELPDERMDTLVAAARP
jgi:gamma-D-glutamyl-L-lysine dipeptidyl-peptidase